ncbi:MAG: hypothetical protein EOO20_17225, partial [Chryseobacterium sp.]
MNRVSTTTPKFFIMKKLILPAFVTLIGAGGALASQNAKANGRAVVDRQGYIFNLSTNSCDPVVMCSTDPGPICTVDGHAMISKESRQDLSVRMWQWMEHFLKGRPAADWIAP